MSEYTKGPWEVGEGKLDGGYLGVFVKGSVMTSPICRVSPIKAMNEEDVYNAYLIAAAPELLEVLKEVEPIGDISEGLAPYYIHSDTIKRIRAAIAKAEGKE